MKVKTKQTKPKVAYLTTTKLIGIRNDAVRQHTFDQVVAAVRAIERLGADDYNAFEMLLFNLSTRSQNSEAHLAAFAEQFGLRHKRIRR